MDILKLGHITFIVEDIEKSLYFYRDLLNLEVNRELDLENGEKIVFLGRDGDTLLELIKGEKSSENKDISIGFYVDSIEDKIKSIKEKIDIEPSALIKPNPYISFLFIEDPDGYRVQLLEENNYL